MKNLPRGQSTLGIVVAVTIGLSLSSAVFVHGSTVAFARAWGTAQVTQAEKRDARPGFCEREGETLLGQKPVRINRSARAPKKLRDVPPKYPELPPGTVGSGMWTGEVLVNDSGKVAHLWPTREVELKPPFPSFNTAITDAIRQWQFEPLLIQGKPTAFCMSVTINIDWK